MRKPLKLLSKIIALCLAVCCILCLSACKGDESANPSEKSDSPATGNANTSTTSPGSTAISDNADKPTAPTGSSPATGNATTPATSSGNPANSDNADKPTAPLSGSPAETVHSHNYVDFKCAGCGALQDGHLSDYLISYVKKNGTANGETVSVDVTVGTTLYGLTYNTTGKYFFFSLLDSEFDDFLSIKFTTKKDTYEIAYLQGDEATGREIYGTIFAPEFTKNTPIAVDLYNGPDNERPNAAENARICTVLMLDFLKQFFADNNVGITLSDLGFVAY